MDEDIFICFSSVQHWYVITISIKVQIQYSVILHIGLGTEIVNTSYNSRNFWYGFPLVTQSVVNMSFRNLRSIRLRLGRKGRYGGIFWGELK